MSKTHSSSRQRPEKKFHPARERAAQKSRSSPSPLSGQGRRIMDIEAALSPFWAWRMNHR
jgi:hypothetical protein